MRVTLKIWRQAGPQTPGELVDYVVDDVSPDMSFLEVLDTLNETISLGGGDPIAFDHDCREGICGACGMMIDGQAHGPLPGTTVCQLHMRTFADGDTITVEPWRARSFPVIKDLVVDRSAFDRIIEAGGYITASTGSAPEAHAVLVPKRDADVAFEAAACIGCGACVAACPNASATLFVAAKATHLGSLPQGAPEHLTRVRSMVETQDRLGFGGCSNAGECARACPKRISLRTIARLNRDTLRAQLADEPGEVA